MTPMLSSEMMRYSTNTEMKPMTVARPTSRAYFARPEMTTAPSMPVNTHTSAIMVDTICVPRSGPPASPQKFSMKMAGSNLPSSAMDSTNSESGTSFAMVTMTLMPAASFTPRDTSHTSSHRNADAHTHDSRLLPLSNGWKKYPSAENSRMANDTFDRHADTQ